MMSALGASMEAFRHQRSPGSDRFLGLFSPPPPQASSAEGDELHEDDILWTGSDSPDPIRSPRPFPPTSNPNPSPNPKSASRGIPERNIGILAALSEDDKNCMLRGGSSASPSASRMIPAMPKAKAEYKIHHQSAPVNVPVGPPKARKGVIDFVGEVDDERDEADMLPPHEIVARASPMTTFSVLEGAGRTLKGRDLRRVRNAVWRKTGFVD
ncbi:uncharacterized protein [Typha angustifolia]|uniref:uncharacterized protein n=1 Tax=Typha angustifolia TaxID=59011 RepID=UPI003C2B0CFF